MSQEGEGKGKGGREREGKVSQEGQGNVFPVHS